MAEFLGLGFRYEGFTVSAARDGPQALRSAQEERPDLVVLDLRLPGMDGLDVCRHLRARDTTPIIILTARDAVDDRVAGLEAGADDYLVKPFHFQELLARVWARLRAAGASGASLHFADLVLDTGLHEAVRGGRRITLTDTEYRLLEFLIRHPRQVLAKTHIIEAVWGYDFDGDENVVEQYVRSLRRKLGSPSLIHTLRLAGYVLREIEP